MSKQNDDNYLSNIKTALDATFTAQVEAVRATLGNEMAKAMKSGVGRVSHMGSAAQVWYAANKEKDKGTQTVIIKKYLESHLNKPYQE